jgi:AraC-like DNA-binding protein
VRNRWFNDAMAEVLRDLIQRHVGNPALPGVALLSSVSTSLPSHEVVRPALIVVAQGHKRAVLGDRVYEYGAGQYLVVSVDLPLTGRAVDATPQRPFVAALLELDPTAIAALLLESATAAHPRRGAPTGIAVSDAPADLVDALTRLVRLLDTPAEIPVLAPGIQREILWRLITGEQGAMVRDLGVADSGLAQVSRATRWIRDHYAEALRVEDLARVAGMSPSSFHRHFRAVTALTPVQYQKRIRLQEARARLLADPGNVGAVGFAVGYNSPSQFSREYRRLFGAPPGADAARLAS